MYSVNILNAYGGTYDDTLHMKHSNMNQISAQMYMEIASSYI